MANETKFPPDPYAGYADHPRFGRRPRITGLNPAPFEPSVNLHWIACIPEMATRYDLWPGNYREDIKRIDNTGILADLSRQTPATVAVTHYFDVDRSCVDCRRRFIFFAEEQKFWYEDLGFPLESDCVRCMDCRKQQQGIARTRQRYEELFHESDKTQEQTLEMAECCMQLIEASIFSSKQTKHVRELLNKVAENEDAALKSRRADLLARVRSIEKLDG
jgi:hypothetical protein